MKIAVVQMDVQFGKPDDNFSKADEFITEAARQGADTVVLPEMWNTGFALGELETLADNNGERTKKFLSELSKNHNVHIVGGSVATKKSAGFYNTMYVTNRAGEIIFDYDKIHLFPLMDEHSYMQQGEHSGETFYLDGIPSGGIICFDLRFPELFRKQVLDGAKMMFVPAQWPKPRVDHWETLLRARAIENQCFVIAVNSVGRNPDNVFNGHSMVISPWGELLLSGKEEEGIFYVEIDVDEVDRTRQRIPIFSARRTNLY